MQTSRYDTSKGSRLKRWIKTTIGFYLREERRKRNLTIKELAANRYVPVSEQGIESVELGCGYVQWNSISTLLKFYQKDIEITLVDIKKE